MKVSTKYKYLIGIGVGYFILIFASSLFLLPILAMSGSFNLEILTDANALNNLVYEYQGFLMIPGYLVAIVLAIVFLKDEFVKDFKYFIKHIWVCLIWIAIATVLIIGISHLFDLIYEVLDIDTSSANQEAIVKSLLGDGKWAMILSVAIVGPIFEELLFRKCTYGFLSSTNIPRYLSVIITVFIFAIIHCTTENFFAGYEAWIFLANYLALSCVLTLPFVFNKSNIYVSTIIHIINNVISILAVYGVLDVFIF